MESILQDGSSDPRSLPLEYLRKITDNFSDERLLGQGGFGKVYKGVQQNGEMIAVKKFVSPIPLVKDRQFENEAKHLMSLKHRNIVVLVGCCSETENIYVEYKGKYIFAEKTERFLCLEFMPKGSLRGFLSDESSGLSWDTRCKIIEGICYGLHYLHEEWQVNNPIIHMDLKPENILLDNYMVPKIADFGLSRLFSEEKTWTCTTSRDGTLGYMAPEYINRGIITKKSDIFSLGVIIIEIMTGHKGYPDEIGPSSQEFIEDSQKFTELILNNWRNRLEKAPGTSFEISCQQIRRCIQIGLVCVNLDREKRPTTSQIIKMLHGSAAAECSNRKEAEEGSTTMASGREEPSHKAEAKVKFRHVVSSVGWAVWLGWLFLPNDVTRLANEWFTLALLLSAATFLITGEALKLLGPNMLGLHEVLVSGGRHRVAARWLLIACAVRLEPTLARLMGSVYCCLAVAAVIMLRAVGAQLRRRTDGGGEAAAACGKYNDELDAASKTTSWVTNLALVAVACLVVRELFIRPSKFSGPPVVIVDMAEAAILGMSTAPILTLIVMKVSDKVPEITNRRCQHLLLTAIRFANDLLFCSLVWPFISPVFDSLTSCGSLFMWNLELFFSLHIYHDAMAVPAASIRRPAQGDGGHRVQDNDGDRDSHREHPRSFTRSARSMIIRLVRMCPWLS